jgi:hypothetical protein
MQVRGIFGEGEIIAPPRFDAHAALANGFVMCPLALQHAFQGDRALQVQELYQLAYERARAAHRPSWYERLYRMVEN